MRRNIALALSAALLALSLSARDLPACEVWSGGVAEDCLVPLSLQDNASELYAVKISRAGGGTTDWHYDLSVKTSGRADASNRIGDALIGTSFTYSGSPENHTAPYLPTDTLFIYITFSGGRTVLDSELSSLGGGSPSLG